MQTHPIGQKQQDISTSTSETTNKIQHHKSRINNKSKRQRE